MTEYAVIILKNVEIEGEIQQVEQYEFFPTLDEAMSLSENVFVCTNNVCVPYEQS